MPGKTVLRDLTARVGLDYDASGFVKASDSIRGLTKNLKGVGAAIAGVAGALGVIRLVELASDATETMNVIDVSFGKSKDNVIEWSRTFSREAKRSKYGLQEMASGFGVMLTPMLDNNMEASARLSKRLTELAVDLRSLHNLTSDKEAFDKLKAGISGEMEPLRRLGIIMKQDNLQRFAKEKGIHKSIKAMKEAEITELRAAFIIEKSAIAHGDAAKTALEYANAKQGLRDGFRDLGVTIGTYFLPTAKWVVNALSDMVWWTTKLIEDTEILDAVLLALGVTAVAVAGKIKIAFLPIALKFALIGIAIAAVVLIIEDFFSLLNGKKSVIGDFINMIFGPGSAEEAVKMLKAAWRGTVDYVKDTVIPNLKKLKYAVKWMGDLAGRWFENFKNKALEFFEPVITKIKNLITWVRRLKGYLPFLFGDAPAIGEGVFDKKTNFGFAKMMKNSARNGAAFIGEDTEKLKRDFERMNKKNKIMDRYNTSDGAPTGLTASIMNAYNELSSEGAKLTVGRRRGEKGSKNVVINQNTTVNATQANASADEIAEAVTDAKKRENRKLANALVSGVE